MADPASPNGGDAGDDGSPAQRVVSALDHYVARVARFAAGGCSPAGWAEDVAWCAEAASSWWSDVESCISGHRGDKVVRKLGHKPGGGLVGEPVEVPLLPSRPVFSSPPTASDFRGIGWGMQLRLPAHIVAIQSGSTSESLTITLQSVSVAACIPLWAQHRTVVFEGVILGVPVGTHTPAALPITEPIRITKPAYIG